MTLGKGREDFIWGEFGSRRNCNRLGEPMGSCADVRDEEEPAAVTGEGSGVDEAEEEGEKAKSTEEADAVEADAPREWAAVADAAWFVGVEVAGCRAATCRSGSSRVELAHAIGTSLGVPPPAIAIVAEAGTMAAVAMAGPVPAGMCAGDATIGT